MSLAQLQIHHLRNIKSARLDFHPHINLFSGVNGSGKTSVLEAIYLLGSGHSFRTREILPLISQGEETMTVFSRTLDEQSISIQKSVHSPTLVRINKLTCQSSSELAHFLPCQVFYQDIFQIIDAGPAIRRTVLDWGLFHVKQDYHFLWKDYKRALKQRNYLLKQKASPKDLEPWNSILDELASRLHQAREQYFLQLRPEFEKTLMQLSNFHCSLNYYKGWDKRDNGKSLATILAESYQKDILRQFTHYGPHQADLFVASEDFTAKQYLSRGQQKILLFALKLAQANLTPKSCIYLCDDLASELDKGHVERLLHFFLTVNGQFFITSTQPLDDYFQTSKDIKLFSVLEGKVTE
ncbi:DNA replication/repair protein RecF [Legionella jamestowniensis]|uniref:DNA replication and repair protein RecF n=1 Tax=Legionella jamestowniensis TaxID=455 RepID=A0A0W0UIQ5_9GAMM|nr:DNA replication/repair protein RecF [Legionella jamestowniensis]KTD07722.1 RecF recombinational DNA repair ATPase [Legionella jamestowniensis]OCH99459.1 DNA replication/repair protein RecF [Legionella jamestowniensis]SFL61207.1 DNA replication and repair protein RecF [Legionella jamestowniensis DSM 19215]